MIGAMPLLVLANKVDLLPPTHRAGEEVRGWNSLAEELNLNCSGRQRWSVLGISATRLTNLDKVLRWLVLQAHGADQRGGADGSTAGSDEGPRVPRSRARLWEWLSTPRRRGWWTSRYSFLADASRSLVADAET